MSRSSETRAISRRIGLWHEITTASGVSSMMISTPVAASMARMLRPSRPMIRPFISSLGSASTETVRPTNSPASRSIAIETIRLARRSDSSAPPPRLSADFGRRHGEPVRPFRPSGCACFLAGQPGDRLESSSRFVDECLMLILFVGHAFFSVAQSGHADSTPFRGVRRLPSAFRRFLRDSAICFRARPNRVGYPAIHVPPWLALPPSDLSPLVPLPLRAIRFCFWLPQQFARLRSELRLRSASAHATASGSTQ